jgi:hypothetical protein
MNASIAFFDTCTRHPNDDNTAFVIAEKMARARRSTREILNLAEMVGAPVLSTTCLGIQRQNPGMCARSTCASPCNHNGEPATASRAFVGMSASDADIRNALDCRHIVLERTSCKSGEENVKRRAFDVFATNRHAETIVRALGPREWFVFGAGFEHCLLAVVKGLRQMELPVTVIASACIHGGLSTPVSFLNALHEIEQCGARWESSDAFADIIRQKASLPEPLVLRTK